MRVKDLKPILNKFAETNSNTLIQVISENESLFWFYASTTELVLKYFMNNTVDHISLGVDPSNQPYLQIYIDKKENVVMASNFIKSKFEELFKDENNTIFWPSNKDRTVNIIVQNGSKCYSNSIYHLTSYDDIDDFVSSCRWEILEAVTKDLIYKSHTVDNDEIYILTVEVTEYDNDK